MAFISINELCICIPYFYHFITYYIYFIKYKNKKYLKNDQIYIFFVI